MDLFRVPLISLGMKRHHVFRGGAPPGAVWSTCGKAMICEMPNTGGTHVAVSVSAVVRTTLLFATLQSSSVGTVKAGGSRQ